MTLLAVQKKRRAVEKASLVLDYLSNPEEDVSRNMDGEGHSDKVLDGTEEYITRNWRKGDPCYKVAKILAELCSCPSVLWKVELVSDEIGYLAGEISKQHVEEPAWFLLDAYSKM